MILKIIYFNASGRLYSDLQVARKFRNVHDAVDWFRRRSIEKGRPGLDAEEKGQDIPLNALLVYDGVMRLETGIPYWDPAPLVKPAADDSE